MCWQMLAKFSNNEFNENPLSGSQSCYMRTDGLTDIVKLIGTFCNFSIATYKTNFETFTLCAGFSPV
jgi:hypothetical protein